MTRATSVWTSSGRPGSPSAGHGGQILISETTRVLLGNQVPDGVQVHDLGEQSLKDVQHEHIYELSVDGAPAAPKPLKTEARESTFEERMEARIKGFVEEKLERALERKSKPE